MGRAGVEGIEGSEVPRGPCDWVGELRKNDVIGAWKRRRLDEVVEDIFFEDWRAVWGVVMSKRRRK